MSVTELPRGWQSVRIKDVTEPKVPQMNCDGPLTYVDIGSVDNATKRIVDPKRFLRGDDIPSRARQLLAANDVLVSMTRPNLNAVALVPSELDGAIGSTGFDILRASDVEPKWLFNIVKSEQFITSMSAIVQGALYPAVRPSDIRDYEIPLPPLPEQRRIVAKIEALQERSSRARKELEEVRPLLEQFRQSVLQAAFSGRLTADWRAQNPDIEPASELLARIRTERRNRWVNWEVFKHAVRGRKVPRNIESRYEQPESSEDLDTSVMPKIPGTWCWAYIDEIGIVGSGKRLAKGSKLVTYDTGFPYIRAGNLKGGTVRGEILYLTKEDYERIPQYNVCAGDCYLTIVGASIGDAGTIPEEYDGVNLTENAAKIMPTIDGSFLGYILRSPSLQDQIQGRVLSAAQGKLALARIKKLIVPVPPLFEQVKIALLVTELLERIDDAASDAGSYNLALTQLDQSILAKAFRGELVPQDPNDEPASALLERIHQQRAAQANRSNMATRKRASDDGQ